jgi:hypothetical protein
VKHLRMRVSGEQSSLTKLIFFMRALLSRSLGSRPCSLIMQLPCPAPNATSGVTQRVNARVQRVLHDDMKQDDIKMRDPNSDEELGLHRDPFTRRLHKSDAFYDPPSSYKALGPVEERPTKALKDQ